MILQDIANIHQMLSQSLRIAVFHLVFILKIINGLVDCPELLHRSDSWPSWAAIILPTPTIALCFAYYEWVTNTDQLDIFGTRTPLPSLFQQVSSWMAISTACNLTNSVWQSLATVGALQSPVPTHCSKCQCGYC